MAVQLMKIPKSGPCTTLLEQQLLLAEVACLAAAGVEKVKT